MTFNSWSFLLFFIAFYALFAAAKSALWKRNIVLAASFIFYGLWSPLYLIIISWVILFDYTSIALMERTGRRKLFLALSISDAVLILGVFKYSRFIVSNINSLLSAAGAGISLPAPGILFPVGISFFLFMSLGNTIDIFYGRAEREKSILNYAAFVSFFPYLLSGPIERGNRMLPLVRSWPRVTAEDIADGVYLFVRGMFKKMALADYFALYADKIFGNPAAYPSGDLIAGALAFTWQIYFDFSGYTDMARGVARSLGIKLLDNFNLPYIAHSTSDFWARWHISLSSWFRDYLYIPLGGSRNGAARGAINTFCTMLVSGLWHGASWNFLLWGFIHGALHATGKLVGGFKAVTLIPVFIKRIFVFILIVFTWIFFRSENASDAFTFIERIFTTGFPAPPIPSLMIVLMAASYAAQWINGFRRPDFADGPFARGAAVFLMLAYMLLFVTYSSGEFIYFQF